LGSTNKTVQELPRWRVDDLDEGEGVSAYNTENMTVDHSWR
jgi:hypothetical protein